MPRHYDPYDEERYDDAYGDDAYADQSESEYDSESEYEYEYEYDVTGSGSPGRLEFFRAYAFVFEHPAWFTNLLLISMTQMIPIVGPIAVMGYQYEVMDSLLRWPDHSYPRFEFQRLGDYLARGVWPFLVVFVVSCAVFPLLYLMFIFAFVVGLVGAAQVQDPVMVILVIGVLLVLFAVTVFAFQLVSQAMALRAGLAAEFSAGFELSAVFGFVSRVWVESILEALFLMVTGPIIILAGLLACFVGVFPASSLLMLAQAHLNYQTYELDLYRGGIPVRLPQ